MRHKFRKKNPSERTVAERDYRQSMREERWLREHRATVAVPVAQRVLSDQRRAALVERVSVVMASYEFSKFEHEGSTRAALRSAWCLEGHAWQAADGEAEAVVAATLKKIGAVRPSFLEGQWHYCLSRDHCSWCHRPIEGDDATFGQRFCSVECARAALDHRAREEGGRRDAVMNAALKLILRRKREPRICACCGKPFRSLRKETRYCSQLCVRLSTKPPEWRLDDVPCASCGKMFHPANRGARYCSYECAWEGRTVSVRCDCCGTAFTSNGNQVRYCSPRCRWKIDRANRKARALGAAGIVTAGVFDREIIPLLIAA